MQRGNLNDLVAFVTVVPEHCFTSRRSAWSFPVGGQPCRAGLRPLTRVSPTPTAERSLQTVSPRFEEIEPGLWPQLIFARNQPFNPKDTS
jgi:hypothetical protein